MTIREHLEKYPSIKEFDIYVDGKLWRRHSRRTIPGLLLDVTYLTVKFDPKNPRNIIYEISPKDKI